MRASSVIQSHHLTNVAQRLLRELARLLAAVGDNAFHERWILEIPFRPLANRRLFCEYRLNDRLLAVETPDAGAAATLLNPHSPGLVRIHFVQLPDRAFLRLP